ncbi:carbohydrate-binding protein [Salana multivorans]
MSRRFPGRRLSLVRLTVLVVVVAAIAFAGYARFQWWEDQRAAGHATPWFAAYVDTTAVPAHAFESPQAEEDRNVVLAFIVAESPTDCTASWGTYQTTTEAQDELDLDRRIARLRQAQGDVVVSFGGEANSELALACDDVEELTAQYQAVLDRYRPTAIDFDVEGEALADAASRERRAEAVAQLQAARSEPLAIWLTLPVGPDGLTPDGVATVRAFLEAGVRLDGVNAMTMNYTGQDAADDQARVAIASLRVMHRQLKAIYADRGTPIGDQTAWRMVGATPMIGQNNVPGEVFTLEDARTLNEFALEVGIGRMSLWSANRDHTCADAYADLSVMSVSCSGVDQGDERFTTILGEGFDGAPGPLDEEDAAAIETIHPEQVTDDPETSPYPIWQPGSSYPADTRVVWRRNVYLAKWWNTRSQPDDPSVASTDNPWTLVGPVLPGEKPLAQQIPEGTYPDWSPTTAYEEGDRVMLDSVAYEAKWWNQGEHPGAGQANPGESAWQVVTEE